MSAKRGYYGPLIWLAVVSMAAPIVVAVRAFQELPRPYTAPAINPDPSGVDQNLWDHLLRKYVENGLIDYDGIKRDYLFTTYLRQLSHAEPEKLATDDDRLALLCNAYNAMVIDGVVTHKIHDSVLNYQQDGTEFFDLKEHILAGETISLNDLEHRKIRAKFRDPRIHMTLVCAAKSCPVIRGEAYYGTSLQRQLEDQATLFANDPAYVRFDPNANVLRLSKILEWYGDDFGGRDGYIDFLAQRVEKPDVKQSLQGVLDGSVAVEFNDYDWSLNTQAHTDGNTGKRSGGDFGSGSIPNE